MASRRDDYVGCQTQEIIRHQSGSREVRGIQCGPNPKRSAPKGTIAAILGGKTDGDRSDRRAASKALVGCFGGYAPEQLTAASIADICQLWSKLSPGTRIGYHGALRHWIMYLQAPIRCLEGIAAVKSPDSPTTTVSDTDFERAYVAADTPLALMLLLTREAGLRAATAYNLTPANLTASVIHATTKNHGSIAVPMTPRLARLAAYAASRCSPNEPLLYGAGLTLSATYVGSSHSVALGNTMRHRLAALQKRLGLGDWTWHDLRRTAAQRLYAKSGNLNVVKELLGHKSILNTLVYLNAAKRAVTLADVAMMAANAEPSKGTPTP